MTSLERLLEYTDLSQVWTEFRCGTACMLCEDYVDCLHNTCTSTTAAQEPPLIGEPGGDAPPPGWPRSGELMFDQVTATYRPGLPPVLREVTFHLPAGTSCGLVGRTGDREGWFIFIEGSQTPSLPSML